MSKSDETTNGNGAQAPETVKASTKRPAKGQSPATQPEGANPVDLDALREGRLIGDMQLMEETLMLLINRVLDKTETERQNNYTSFIQREVDLRCERIADHISKAKAERVPLIYSAIRNVMKSIIPLAKTHIHPQEEFTFRTIDELAAVLQPLCVEHGIFWTPQVLEEREIERMVHSASGSYVQIFTKVRVAWHLYSALDGSRLPEPVVTMGEAMSELHFSTAAAQTFAFKQMLWVVFCIPVFGGADPESIEGARSQASAPAPNPANQDLASGPAPNMPLFDEAPQPKRRGKRQEPQTGIAGIQEGFVAQTLDEPAEPARAALTAGGKGVLITNLKAKNVTEQALFEHFKIAGWEGLTVSDMGPALSFIAKQV